jgi:hypothetical protein
MLKYKRYLFIYILEMQAKWWLDIDILLIVKDLLFRPSLIACILIKCHIFIWH